MRILTLLLITLSLYGEYIQKGTKQYPITIEGQQGHEFYRGYSLDYGFFSSKHEFDPKKGIELLKVAVLKNDVLAMFDMYEIYQEGIYGEDVNTAKANELLNKSLTGIQVLAKHGNIRAMALLGNIYQKGLGTVEVNKSEALKLYEKSAKEGNALAYYYRAACYRYDNSCGTKKDIDWTLDYYSQANSKGLKIAATELGILYYFGKEGIAFDISKAKSFFDDAHGEYRATSFLGGLYRYKKQPKEAFKFSQEAAQLGSKVSHFRLVEYWYFEDRYKMGTKDLSKAKYHLLEAKKRGWKEGDEYLEQLRTPSEKLYHNLMQYKGKQTKEKVLLLNKEPLFSSQKQIKISDDGKKVILNNKVYRVNPFELIYEEKQKDIKVMDFFKNDYLFIATSKKYGLYSLEDKKFNYQHLYTKVLKSVYYSNGIARYTLEDKKQNKKGFKGTYMLYFEVTLNKLDEISIMNSTRHLEDDLFVNEDKTKALLFNDSQLLRSDYKIPSRIELLDLKNADRTYVSKMSDKCKSTNIRFLSKNNFVCGQYFYDYQTKQVNQISGEFVLDEKRYLTYDFSKVGIYDIKTRKRLDEIPFKDYVRNDNMVLSKSNQLMVARTSKEKMYNIYNVTNFLGNKESKIINQTWLEVGNLVNNGSKLNENESLEQALATAYSKDIQIDSSHFKYKDNKVEVTLDTFGTVTFKAEDIINSLSNTYLLKNIKFEVQNDDIKLIAADLFPSDSGYILSYGRATPAYKQSLEDLQTKYKLSLTDEKRVKKANKMYLAGLFDEAESLYDIVIEKNPIGFDGNNRINLLSHKSIGTVGVDNILEALGLGHRLYTKTKVNIIKELKSQKKMRLGLQVVDVDDIKKQGALIQKILSNNSDLKVGDVIVSIDSNTVKRASDAAEIINSLESSSTLDLEVLRNNVNIKFNIQVKSVFKYPSQLLRYYRLYILRAIDAEKPEAAQEAWSELQTYINEGTLLVTKVEKEKNLLIEALVLIKNNKEKEAFKKLFAYDEAFEKESIEVLLKSNNPGWGHLLKYRKKFSILFDIPSNKFKSREASLGKYDIYDINGNLVKSDEVKTTVKKKLQPTSQKGGVLE